MEDSSVKETRRQWLSDYTLDVPIPDEIHRELLRLLRQYLVVGGLKAGKTGTLKSMHLFVREKDRAFALRFNSDTPSLCQARTSLAAGDQKPFRLLSLPLYLVGQAKRLCRAALRDGGPASPTPPGTGRSDAK